MDLGLTDEQFGEITPRQLQLLWDRKEQHRKHERRLFGLVASITAMFSANPPKNPLGPDDFFRRRRPKRDTDEEITARNRAFLMSQVTTSLPS